MKLPGRLDDSLRGGDVLIDLLSSNGTRLVFGIVGREGAAIRFDRSSVSQELEVVARYQLPLILVVFEDGAFGLIQAYQRRAWSQEEAISTVFKKVDFVKLAEANGCRARRANNEDEFKEAFVEALVAKQPYVLIVPVSYDTNWID
jgi:thiamine pyrophosphate-dependent acetolactate synthase large subunit-like protein